MKTVKITYGNLKEIQDSYGGCNCDSALVYLQQLEPICDYIEEELDTATGSTARNARHNLQDVRDSLRGLETSYHQVQKEIGKYVERMEAKLEAINEESIISVTEYFEEFQKNIKDSKSDCKDALKSNVGNIHSMTVKNKNIKDLSNMTIDQYNSYTSNCRQIVDEKFEDIKKELKVLEDWNDADYHEVYHTVKSVAVIGTSILISTTPIGALAVGGYCAAKAGIKMYRHGYSLEGSVSGAVVVGAIDWATNKVGGMGGSKISSMAEKGLSKRTSTLTNLANNYRKELLSGKQSLDWVKNRARNDAFVEYIEGKADGIEVSRYIKGDGFEVLQGKFKYKFESNTTFDRISSEEILENYIEEVNLYNADIDNQIREFEEIAEQKINFSQNASDFFKREKTDSVYTILKNNDYNSLLKKRDLQDVIIDSASTSAVSGLEDSVIEGDDGLEEFLQTKFDGYADLWEQGAK